MRPVSQPNSMPPNEATAVRKYARRYWTMSLHIFEMVGPFIVPESIDYSDCRDQSVTTHASAQALSRCEVCIGVAWRAVA